jgi:hypothetical protein
MARFFTPWPRWSDCVYWGCMLAYGAAVAANVTAATDSRWSASLAENIRGRVASGPHHVPHFAEVNDRGARQHLGSWDLLRCGRCCAIIPRLSWRFRRRCIEVTAERIAR